MVAVTVFKGKSTTASLIVSASSTRCEDDEEEVVLAMTVAVVLFRANVVDSSEEEVELAGVVVAVAGLLSPRVPLWTLEAVVLPVGQAELT